MALSQLQQDLQLYAEGKLFTMIKDTTQAFEIAGRPRDAMTCMVAMFLKAAVTIVINVYGPDSRERFLEAAAMCFDHEVKDHNSNDERD